ncbi:MAG: hypothetical protein FWD58_06565 [Firmicutes bacterium]|nr:hypothetical protein [Bacillota bacterium]
MRCKSCLKEIDCAAAVYCSCCGKHFCEKCAAVLGVCECSGDMRRYS